MGIFPNFRGGNKNIWNHQPVNIGDGDGCFLQKKMPGWFLGVV